MHPSVMRFIEEQVYENGLTQADTLEVGSYDVNGSVRPLFKGPYVGVDINDGPGVDIVVGQKLPFKDGRFELVVSTEMLEHCEFPNVALAEMNRVLIHDGWLLLTARGYDFPHHNPPDYHRFSTEMMEGLLNEAGFVEVRVGRDPGAPGVFAIARGS